MRKNFDPFLGNGNIVKVRLTEEGESLLKSLTNYRPKLVKKRDISVILRQPMKMLNFILDSFLKEAENFRAKAVT